MADSSGAAYTFADAAKACDVSQETIRLRVRRGKLPRGRPTNSGRPTVLLTSSDIEAIKAGRPFRPTASVRQLSGPVEQPDGQTTVIATLTDHLTTLREQAAHDRATLNQVREAADRERVLAAEERLAAAAERLALQARVDALAMQLAGLQGAPMTLAPVLGQARQLLARLRRKLGR